MEIDKSLHGRLFHLADGYSALCRSLFNERSVGYSDRANEVGAVVVVVVLTNVALEELSEAVNEQSLYALVVLMLLKEWLQRRQETVG